MGFRGLLLVCAALWPMGVAHTQGGSATPARPPGLHVEDVRAFLGAPAGFTVSYLEARSTAIGAVRMLLQQQVAHERAVAVSHGASAFDIDVLQEIDRPERWELLEWTGESSQREALEAAMAPALTQLQSLLVAPPDQRRNHELPQAGSAGSDAGLFPDSRSSAPSNTLYAVTHLDIGAGKQGQSSVVAAIGRLMQAGRAARGNLRAEAWQEDSRLNHYTLLFVWTNRADRDAFIASPSARRFRDFVGPLLGSPYDERLCRISEAQAE